MWSKEEMQVPSNLSVEEFISDLCFWGVLEEQEKAIIGEEKGCDPKNNAVVDGSSIRNDHYLSDTSSSRSRSPATKKTTPPEEQEQPPIWRTAIDPSTGNTYYYDALTRRTQWEKPAEIRAIERRRRRRKRREDRLFFQEMERNILKSLARGETTPGMAPNTGTRNPLRRIDNNKNETQRPLPKQRIRTISGLDEVLLKELSDDTILLPTPKPLLRRSSTMETNKTSTTASSTDIAASSSSSSSLLNRPPLPGRRPVLRRQTTSSSAVSLEFSPEESREPRAIPAISKDHPLIMQREESESLRGEALLDVSLDDSAATTTTTHLLPQPQPHIRRNTEGTVFVQSTMTNPDIEATIKCVCGVYRAHIQQALKDRNERSPNSSIILSRNVFSDVHRYRQTLNVINTAPASELPPLDDIVDFYKDFFQKSHMEHDTIIMSLIYIERLIKETELVPLPENYKSILFSCMVLASKVWDDLSMWNIDFSKVCGRDPGGPLAPFTLARINQLEIALLQALDFNVKIPASEYAKYYFLIRSMLIKSGLLLTEQSQETSDGSSGEEDNNDTTSTTLTTTTTMPAKRWQHRNVKSVDNCFFSTQQSKLMTTSCIEQLVSMSG